MQSDVQKPGLVSGIFRYNYNCYIRFYVRKKDTRLLYLTVNRVF